jgi:hypothetical protein
MKEIFFSINVLPIYTKSHSDKYLNHLKACKMSPSILAIAELFELMHEILTQAFNSQAQIPFAR